MIKHQDILILVDVSKLHQLKLEEQKEIAEAYYKRSGTAVLIKTVSMSHRNYYSKVDEIKGLLRLGNFRIIVCHRNLLTGTRILLRLFNKAKSIGAIKGTIERYWIKDRLKTHLRAYHIQKKYNNRFIPKGPTFDSFGLPIINNGEKGTLNNKLAKKAIQRERNKKKEALRKSLHIAEMKKKLDKSKEKFRIDRNKEMYDIITWYAPIEKIATNQEAYDRAVLFLKKMKSFKNIPPNIIPAVIIANTSQMPKRCIPSIRSILTNDRKFVYESKPKRSNRKV